MREEEGGEEGGNVRGNVSEVVREELPHSIEKAAPD